MTVCQHCGACIPDNIPFCDFCGEDLSREPLRQQPSIPHMAEPASAPRAGAEKPQTSARMQTAEQPGKSRSAADKAAAAAAAGASTVKAGTGRTSRKSTATENRTQTPPASQTYSERVRAQKADRKPTAQPSGYMKAEDPESPPKKTVSRTRTAPELPRILLKRRSIPRSRGWLVLYWLILSVIYSCIPTDKYVYTYSSIIAYFIVSFPIGLIFLLLWTRKNRNRPGCLIWFIEMTIAAIWLMCLVVIKFPDEWALFSFPAALIAGGIWYFFQ